eukprot:CAMPEP_0198210772 /NCGR_PEP_ID=MMETSP1445-20131203/22301_1 /TAXON_ID=36898 /ORGANISM="Pyramimonas sp., Strain CCMP2087" /LENGTH=57 /DNA_ID=CAMNT_0043884915 /DNA_START=135 /DNA_END=308 /DNA_ORIENTATION=-
MGAHVPPGAFGLVKEIVCATALGTAGFVTFKMWHLQERKKVNDFYSALAKKNASLAQ